MPATLAADSAGCPALAVVGVDDLLLDPQAVATMRSEATAAVASSRRRVDFDEDRKLTTLGGNRRVQASRARFGGNSQD